MNLAPKKVQRPTLNFSPRIVTKAPKVPTNRGTQTAGRRNHIRQSVEEPAGNTPQRFCAPAGRGRFMARNPG